ncbi:hypothetical protein [Streptomyces sp. NPDC059278]|uniref:hypothetical protein n=1 Tax=Streptomyces sp. NPDC059278 TaxID=3346801 RepID=UPI00368C7279
MFDLYAVQAAPASTEGQVTFEKEDGYTESLHLGEYATADAALVALILADELRTTRDTWEDKTLEPPLWGHELFQRRQPDGRANALCVARAAAGSFTLAQGFADAAPAWALRDGETRVQPDKSLPVRWS